MGQRQGLRPRASGTAPDVSSEKTTAIGETEATFHGKIEPHGVPNCYHFEWTKAEAQQVAVEASGGKFSLSLDPDGNGPQPAQTTGAEGEHAHLTNGSPEVKEVILESGEFALGEACSAEGGYLPPEAEIIAIAVEKEVGGVKYYKLTLSKAATSARSNWKISGDDLPYNAAPPVRAALDCLPAIGAGNVSVTGSPAATPSSSKGRWPAAARTDGHLRHQGPHGVTVTAITIGRGWASANGGPAPNGPKATPASNRPTANTKSPPDHRPCAQHRLRRPPRRHRDRTRRLEPPSASTPTRARADTFITHPPSRRRCLEPGDLRDYDELRPRRRHDRPQERRNGLAASL